jgi:hypothetical protein
VWRLPDDTKVRFYKQPGNLLARESDNVLEVTRPGKSPQSYRFAITHAGYSHVELRESTDGNLIWIVDTRSHMVGCSLDLRSNRFTGERDPYPPEVGIQKGIVLPPTR